MGIQGVRVEIRGVDRWEDLGGVEIGVGVGGEVEFIGIGGEGSLTLYIVVCAEMSHGLAGSMAGSTGLGLWATAAEWTSHWVDSQRPGCGVGECLQHFAEQAFASKACLVDRRGRVR